MRCPYCGARNDADARFCENCGRRLEAPGGEMARSPSGSRRPGKKRRGKVTAVILSVVLVIALLISAVVWRMLRISREAAEAEQVVKTGYLGVYTDVPVKQMLDECYGTSQAGSWSSGRNADGKIIVKANYIITNDLRTDLSIQFEMLDDSCFKVASMSLDSEEIYDEDKRLAILHAYYVVYYEQYLAEHSADAGTVEEFANQLWQVSALAVGYGASQEYPGDRSRICALEGKKPTVKSGAELIYSLEDDSIFDWVNTAIDRGTADNTTLDWETEEDAVPDREIAEAPTEPVNIVPSVPSAAPSAPSAPSASSSQIVSLEARVRSSAGELRVREGPGTNYKEIDRLRAGDIVRISELRTVDGTQWGYISSWGWICMDYVDTAFSQASGQASGIAFLGKWGDTTSQRCFLTIALGTSGTYEISLHGSSGAAYSTEWSAIGTYDETDDCIYYASCKCWDTITDDNGNSTEYVKYTDGEGKFFFLGGNIYWQDDVEAMGENRCFERLS